MSFQSGKVEIYKDSDTKWIYEYDASNQDVWWTVSPVGLVFRMSRKTLEVQTINFETNEVIYTFKCEFMGLPKAIKIMIEKEKQKNLRERKGNQF